MLNYAIIIVYHNDDELTKYNISTFQKYHNKNIVIPIKSDDFPQPAYWQYDWMWAYCDNIFYRWFLSKQKVIADRYFVFDYDTLCNDSVENYYSKVWDRGFVCQQHFGYNPNQNPQWEWFLVYEEHFNSDLSNPLYREKRYGVVPFSGTMIRYNDLQNLIDYQISDYRFWKNIISELRMGTILNIHNVDIAQIDTEKHQFITPFAHNLPKNYRTQKGIFHPVKTLKDDA
jgi:hypothetical protein